MIADLQYPYAPLALLTLVLLFWRPHWGLALLAAIFPMDPWAPRMPVPGLNTATILIGVATAVTVLRFGGRIPPLRYSGPVFAFIAVVFVSFAVSIPWAIDLEGPGGSPAIWALFKIWKSTTFTALLFFCAYWWSQTAGDRQRMLQALCIALFLSSVAGLLDFAINVNPTDVAGRASGFVSDANGMAESIGSMMFVPLYLLARRRERPVGLRWQGFAALTYALSLAAIVVSLSRGNWVAFLAAHTVFFAIVNRKILFAGVAVAALVLALGLPLLPEVVRERIASTTETGSVVYRLPIALGFEVSTASRVVFARVGLDMFEASPIWGHGLEAFSFRGKEFGAKYGLLAPKDAHSLVVKLAAEAGLIGLAALTWIVWAVFRCGRRLWRSDSPERVLGAVLLAAGMHILVSNLSANAFLFVSQVSAQFWILFALAARAYVERDAEQEAPAAEPAQVGRWRRFAQRTPAALTQP